MRSVCARWLWLLLLGGATLRLAADPAPFTHDPLTALPLAPSLVAYARASGIPLSGIQLAPAGTRPVPGNSVTLLITLVKGGGIQQWLARIAIDQLTARDQASPAIPDAVIHTSTGLTLRYGYSPEALRVRFCGPFAVVAVPGAPAAPAAKERETRTIVNGDYLQQGVAQYCESGIEIVRREQAANVSSLIYYAGSGPITPAAAAQGRKSAAQINLSPEEERLSFSVYFALTTFFNAATRIPACRAVLEEVADKPSAWSFLKNSGVRVDSKYAWNDVQTIPANRANLPLPAYELPVQLILNGKAGIKATLAVMEPRTPLQGCAGIFAMCLEHPKDPNRRIFIRLLAAR
jgi:hypothetical protein